MLQRRRDISTFGATLRHFRISAGLSQEALAERSGLSVRGISDLERGARRFPRLDTVRMLAGALELDEHDRAILLAAARPELDGQIPQPERAPKPEWSIALRPLPIPPTRLLGRDPEIDRLVALFRTGETRLVTLTGQGGIGKSRLGLAVARSLAGELGGRVAFLELAAVRDPALVPGALASQLGVSLEPGRSAIGAIAQAIGQTPVLLVIDNWEQVIEAAPTMSELLGRCAGLWVLATSRERLRLRGEWEVRVDPLAIPEQNDDVEGIAASPAVQLFVQRADEAASRFALDETNAPVVVEIVRRLEGIPLAIELMAARVRSLSPGALLDRLDERFSLLTEGPRDLPERLRTMQSAIAWSVDLLDESERRCFGRLSVFSGGFTVSSVSGVLETIEPGVGRIEIERMLLSLVDKSLIRSLDRDDEPRFAMYETIRDFAGECLREQNEVDRLLGAHSSYFLALAERLGAELTGPDPRAAFEALETEIANMRAALRYLHGQGAIEPALRLAAAIAWFWTEPRYVPEGQRWFAALLEDPTAALVPAELRIRACIAAGDLAFWQGDLDGSATLHGRALELLRDGGDERPLVAVLRSLGNVALERNDFARADALLLEARDRAGAAGLRWELAAAKNLLGLSQSLRGAPEAAIERHRQSAAVWRELGNRGHVFDALSGLAWAQLQSGRLAESAQTYLEAVHGGRDLERAARLFSASEVIREENGIMMRVRIGETVDQVMGEVQDRLGPERFAHGWHTGQRLTRDQAIDEARLVFEKAAA